MDGPAPVSHDEVTVPLLMDGPAPVSHDEVTVPLLTDGPAPVLHDVTTHSVLRTALATTLPGSPVGPLCHVTGMPSTNTNNDISINKTLLLQG
jgi:hypothetical protein